MTDFDISTHLCSRICHDLISPVGAIGNGVELLAEISPGGDELDLIGQSAATASATLQFYRLAFSGANAGEHVGLGQVHTVVSSMFEQRERSVLIWAKPDGQVSRASARLLCNFLLIASSSLPRGGEISVNVTQDPPMTLTVQAKGPLVKFTDEASSWLATGVADRPPAPAEIHFITAYRHARDAGARIDFSSDSTSLSLTSALP